MIESEKSYSITKVAEILSVTRQTIFKWLTVDEFGNSIIPSDSWYRLPGSNHIRIKAYIIQKIKNKEI